MHFRTSVPRREPGRSIGPSRKSNGENKRKRAGATSTFLANLPLSPLFESGADVHSTTNAIRLDQASLPFKTPIFYLALFSNGIYEIAFKLRTTSCITFIKIFNNFGIIRILVKLL